MFHLSRQAAASLGGLVLTIGIALAAAAAAAPLPAPARIFPRPASGPADGGFCRRLLLGRRGGIPPRQGRQQGGIRICGGGAQHADYEQVSTGDTGHAESVQVTYDPAQVTYGELLRVFFSVAHDPTQLNRQGPDSARSIGR